MFGKQKTCLLTTKLQNMDLKPELAQKKTEPGRSTQTMRFYEVLHVFRSFALITLQNPVIYTPESTHIDPDCLAPWKSVFLYQPVVFRVHVSLPGCIYFKE